VAASLFFHDLSLARCGPIQSSTAKRIGADQVRNVLKGIHEKAPMGPEISEQRGSSLGLADNSLLQAFATTNRKDEPRKNLRIAQGGLYAEISPEYFSEKAVNDFCADARLFIENWRIA